MLLQLYFDSNASSIILFILSLLLLLSKSNKESKKGTRDEIPERGARLLALQELHTRPCHHICTGNFSIGVYKYARPGSISDFIVVFRVACSASYEIQIVIEDIANDSQQAQVFLSRREILTMSPPSDSKQELIRILMPVLSK